MPDLAPVPHPVAGVVVSDNTLLCAIVLADNRQFFHVKAGLLQLFYGLFRLGVAVVNSLSLLAISNISSVEF